jgi:hypothetical protein
VVKHFDAAEVRIFVAALPAVAADALLPHGLLKKWPGGRKHATVATPLAPATKNFGVGLQRPRSADV